MTVYWELFFLNMKIYKNVQFVNSRHFLHIIYFNKRVSLVLFPLIERNFNEIIFLVICICALARVNFTINNIINEAISDISWKIYVRHLFKMDILQYLFWWNKKKMFSFIFTKWRICWPNALMLCTGYSTLKEKDWRYIRLS